MWFGLNKKIRLDLFLGVSSETSWSPVQQVFSFSVRLLVFEVVKLQVKSEALVQITACKDVDIYGLYACFIVP